MEVIVTHEVSDFDALAGAVAARKLYPAAEIVLGRKLGRDVREFMSLHKDYFPTLDARSLDVASVTRCIIVDVRRASRLHHVRALLDRIEAHDPALQVEIWDHHAAADDDVFGDCEHIEPVGSVTTLLVEAIRERQLSIDVVEATLFALGIYVDTGSLRYAGSTARDAAALAYLLGSGARLSVINRYAARPFTDAQLSALTALLAALRVTAIGGARVATACVSAGLATDGLDVVTSEVLALEDVHAVFAFFPVRDGRTQLIARSRSAWLDVGKLARALGGGGHATAAAATLREADAIIAEQRLLELLHADPPRPVRVADVMSSPVHTVTPDAPVSQLAQDLERLRYTGAVVVKAGVPVGVVSQRDITTARPTDRIARHMSSPVRTTLEATLLDDALAAMVAADVGRLPVLRDGRLVGIITRRDVLSALYGSAGGPLR